MHGHTQNNRQNLEHQRSARVAASPVISAKSIFTHRTAWPHQEKATNRSAYYSDLHVGQPRQCKSNELAHFAVLFQISRRSVSPASNFKDIRQLCKESKQIRISNVKVLQKSSTERGGQPFIIEVGVTGVIQMPIPTSQTSRSIYFRNGGPEEVSFVLKKSRE